MKRRGKQTWQFDDCPRIVGCAAVVGPDEGAGPLHSDFDYIYEQLNIGEKNWEKGERKLLEHAAKEAIIHAGIGQDQVDFFVGGDLLNQMVSTSFCARKLQIPYFGVYGACATVIESLALSALLVDTGAANYVLSGTVSHNCTVEKQYRYPTEYGSQKPPYAQYTVTGSGCAVVSKQGEGPIIRYATIGVVTDLGVKDPFNMGAAMAPAAASTLLAHFNDTGHKPSDYDLIVTGDLASVGLPVLKELLESEKISLKNANFNDCGMMIYDRDKQPHVFAGGSGCGCCATVTYGHLVKQLCQGKLKRILVVATGALLSPLTYQQGESIPCIAHAVVLEKGE